MPSNMELYAGGYFNCAHRPNGQLYCWGRNDSGELGIGNTTHQLSPVAVPGMSQVAQLGLGRQHACAIRPSGQIFCWGLNSNGQLGVSNLTNQSSPAAIDSSLRDYNFVVGSADGTIAVRDDASMVGWGRHSLGAPSLSTTPTDKSALFSNVTDLCGGSLHFCARRQDGTVWCWGDGAQGRLGNGSTAWQNAPTQVTGLTNAADVRCGEEYSCARRDDGTVWCWGSNQYRQMGQGSTDSTPQYMAPVQVPGISNATSLDTGSYHVCVTLSTGALSCWGLNREGQLGVGDAVDRGSPTTVPGMTNVTAVAAGSFHTCAVRQNSQVYCWGDGNLGQVGDGTANSRLSPVAVTLP
jgi:alpha-tubulin suppressor-like RCC1 family protein